MALLRDWGAILGVEGERGRLMVPRRNPNPRTGQSIAHEVTPDLLTRTGLRVRVKLYKFNPAASSGVANTMSILNSLGAVDKRTIIEMVGITTDPDGLLRRIEDEALEAVPEVLQARTLKRYVRDAQRAMERGDVETAEELLAEVQFVAEQMGQMQRDKQMEQASLDQQFAEQMAPPDGPQPQGMSMPMMGVPTGQQGGRPPGMGMV